MQRFRMSRLVVVAAFLSGIALSQHSAQAQTPIPYGEAINEEQAQQVLTAAIAEAKTNHWPVAIAIVDFSGFLVAFQRIDNTQLGSVEVSIGKAKTAALFRRPTKFFEEMLGNGGPNLKFLSMPGVTPLEGGVPIVVDGKLIGAIGVSGAKATEDAQVATAGAETLIKKELIKKE